MLGRIELDNVRELELRSSMEFEKLSRVANESGGIGDQPLPLRAQYEPRMAVEVENELRAKVLEPVVVVGS